jgi:hypothetical protein
MLRNCPAYPRTGCALRSRLGSYPLPVLYFMRYDFVLINSRCLDACAHDVWGNGLNNMVRLKQA